MNVFISYRRNDTQDLAGRIADRIRAVRQVNRVFIDVDGIAPGADFASRINAALDDSDVCILLIGPRWLGAREDSGTPRIFDARDFVRQEAAAALASERKILPVLANGASMPQAEDLPQDLQHLPSINALSIRHMYFDHDMEYLVGALLSRKKPGTISAYLAHHPLLSTVLRSLSGACAALLLLLVGAAVHESLTGRSLEESLGGPGPVWLLIAGLLLIGLAAPLFGRLRR